MISSSFIISPALSPTGLAPAGAVITRFGLVSSAAGRGAISASSPYAARSSSMSPKSRARSGQASTQMGYLPAATRSAHMLHFTDFMASMSTLGAP